jgi:hypothetical protein
MSWIEETAASEEEEVGMCKVQSMGTVGRCRVEAG